MEVYLKKSGLLDDLYSSITIAKKRYGKKFKGVGIDLAAGNLWAIPHLYKEGDFEKIYCLEYSRHRLLKLGSVVLNHYSVPCEKTILVYGNFYNIHLPDKSVDFIFLSQAFHHADNPECLLKEMRRVLNNSGFIIIIGEHSIKSPSFFKPLCINCIKQTIYFILPKKLQKIIFGREIVIKGFFPPRDYHYPPDPVLGDHYYTDKQYYKMFRKNGFIAKGIPSSHVSHKSFILFKMVNRSNRETLKKAKTDLMERILTVV